VRSLAIIKRLGVPPDLAPDVVDGGTLNFLESVPGYVDAGWNVNIFTTSATNRTSIERHGTVTVHRVAVAGEPLGAMNPIDRDFEQGMRFVEALRANGNLARQSYRVWHTHHWSGCLRPLLALRGAETFHVHTPHLLLAAKLEMVREALSTPALQHEADLVASAHRVIALSQHEKRQIEAHYGKAPEGVITIPNGVADEFFLPRQSRPVAPVARLLTVARIARQKGLETLLEAVDLLQATHAVHVVVVGGPYRHEHHYWDAVHAMRDALGLQSVVHFVGEQTRTQILAELARADAYLQPSLYESQGIAVLEAMAAGVPVIASRVEAIEESITDGVSGFLIQPGCPRDLANAIATVLDNPSIRERFAANGRRVAQAFTWREMRRKLVECVEEGAQGLPLAPIPSHVTSRAGRE
jgi:glycosyltransferase involved in cell wall biosynthesis